MDEMNGKQGIGARVLRKEDYRHTRGLGNFIADIKMAELTEVAFLRSPLAHATIRSASKPAGQEHRVFFRDDLADAKPIVSVMKLPGFNSSEQPPLASGKTRFVGEPVAMCLGRNRAEAEDLTELVAVDYDELPAVVDAELAASSQPGPFLHEGWNSHLFLTTAADTGIDEAIGSAAVVVKRKYNLSRQAVNSLEGKAVLAYWDHQKNQLVVYASTQVPHMIRTALAEHLGLDQHMVRVIAPDVGGGFGLKCVLQTEEICVAWLAMTFKKPFRWTEDRREHLTSGANCREHIYEITAYADPSGLLLAIEADIIVDAGAYSVWPFTSCLEATMAAAHLPGPYKLANYRFRTRSVATNKPSIVPYRGVARTGINFAMELTIDAIARAVGREAWEVRRDNLVPGAAMPYVNATGKILDSGDYPRSLATVVDAIDVDDIRRRQPGERAAGRLIGVGFANYIEMTAHGTRAFVGAGMPFVPGAEPAAVRLTPDGGLEIRVGVQSHGQGMETSLAQIAHEVLGVDLSKMAVVHGDTELTPFSTGTYASRSITMAGGAVAEACKILAVRLGKIAGHLLQSKPEDLELRGGAFHTATNSIAVGELARIWYIQPQLLSNELSLDSLELTAMYRPKTDTGQYSYGTHGAVVSIDLATGKLDILDYVIAEDCGTRVNPLIVEGQTYGGAAQGIGTALYEEMTYDESGQPLASTLADYLMPGAAEMPNIRMFELVTPSPNTAFGIKGVGEGGAIPPPAAIFNAVNDALSGSDVEVQTTPLSPRRLFAALQEWKKSKWEIAL
ncbi:xanthine dehydrogenase family protein molybdopterin-binding subunit [Rhizobium sp. VS19-DR104.2]|uniref:xanthine dehydrogenase family protein molybdopterin-binding subunit n=1 Tax=unclassified Rhizobium TaxID=2613769 RepID=UPI001CC6B631|nr:MULTISPECIES: xanthine dehydrogenase family protein molybdopterin-binding subunit [unclassified Rhizobium]MBZ5762227.1 xanthine dehydrogenase family protein molybdopterin-binding subunit [Rhizobium sp. VS19-DR96]MBZ5768243.1 xanthine dehydrogenase family protein molybdopterin-binding subunit [Rhizobium sp. VS19-DR129.2]MBZ5775885.1 xanthine dehydrogenase family protein molybdopterin-binding subunit [Rhizobium sp. VS19-DRK62.2]MBZ5787094.1 xanthine dehydrogenase family protein molybdopterin-b